LLGLPVGLPALALGRRQQPPLRARKIAIDATGGLGRLETRFFNTLKREIPMPVDVILKTKIEGLGSEADIVSVKPGYARNYLIPKDFAAPATKATKRQVEELRRKRAEREAQELNDAQELAGKLGKLKLVFVLESGEGSEKVFGSVTSQAIADKLKEAGHTIDRKKIDLPKPIKDLGEHEVPVKLGSDIVAKLNVTVNHPAPKEDPAAAAESADAKGAKKPYKAKKV
jgi:large subunit ribosomal protein L9